VSIPRRGYIAAGLAVAVVGSLGVFSTLNAVADEVPEAPAAAEAPADEVAPPAELPWGDEPVPLKKGVPGASSASLAATGADIAFDRSGSAALEPEFGPKGYTTKKRSLRKSRTVVPPQPPLTEPVPGQGRDVYYHYAGSYQYVESEGTYANLVIGKPKLADDDFHTLAEIAVQSADGHQTVEVGWTVDRGVNDGSEEPHLFVYHWVDGVGKCYNGCGFVPYSKTAVPGGKLPVGVSKRFGIKYFNGAWWIAYDTEWVGYFPDSLWSKTPFTKSGLVQWFGEIASSRLYPCSEMGTGVKLDDAAAARIGTIALIEGPGEPTLSRNSKSAGVEPGRYAVNPLSERTFRYGGPPVKDPDEKAKAC
jgi:hypothetical protein